VYFLPQLLISLNPIPYLYPVFIFCRVRLAEFEINRMRINYQLSIVAYSILRLKQLIDDLSEWENNVRSM
jgi:hypothetical protein